MIRCVAGMKFEIVWWWEQDSSAVFLLRADGDECFFFLSRPTPNKNIIVNHHLLNDSDISGRICSLHSTQLCNRMQCSAEEKGESGGIDVSARSAVLLLLEK